MQPSSLPQKDEIQNRLRKRFLDRLATRLARLRKELVSRNWPALRTECRQIKGGGEAFGYPELTELADAAERSLPEREVPHAMVLPEAREVVEKLIARIDALLIESSSQSRAL